ncbi:MAG: hypothetical protein N2234_06930, partial [Planctomycetota bacterium]|nr:hypothetical protein [Planctomycetota bacterium]
AEFVVPETKEKLLCIIRDSQKGEGEHAQTLYSTKVRCGGMLYTRVRPQGSSTATTYVVLLDYGDKNKSWEKSIAPGPEKVTKLFMMWDRYYDEKFEGEEDPEEGEPPEPPED